MRAMDEAIIILDLDEEEERQGAAAAWDSAGSGHQGVVDLTRNHCELKTPPKQNYGVIDLTATEDVLQPWAVSFPFKNESSDSACSSDAFSPSPSSYGDRSMSNDELSDVTSKGDWRTPYSDISSPEDSSNAKLQNDVSMSAIEDTCLTVKMSPKSPSDNSIALHGWLPSASTSGGGGSPNNTSMFHTANTQPLASTTSMSTEEESETQLPPLNKALLYKLRYFKKLPVAHFFHRMQKPEKNLSPVAMPLSRMSILNTTTDENFHQGTLHFLTEFVTAQHYPPKDLVLHVIQSILLGAEEQANKNEAYMVLMKVQKLHPATLNTVAWDWDLLKEVMERKEYNSHHLFLQYVVQTLDDDFQVHLQRRSFQKSLCKAMLSCDQGSANIKDIITWLMGAVETACDIAVDGILDSSTNCAQRVLFLLQRMLSIAVEVDNHPVMNSNRIADLLFSNVIVLKTRQERELFLSSTENLLLRAKILEMIFLNSCDVLPKADLPLSLYKILYFIANSTLLLENQGPEWQRWDEILHHICILFLSFQRITTDHLRTPILDRADEFLQKPHTKLPVCEDVTEAEVERYMHHFWTRTSLGSEAPAAFQNHFAMLKSLLLTEVKRQTR